MVKKEISQVKKAEIPAAPSEKINSKKEAETTPKVSNVAVAKDSSAPHNTGAVNASNLNTPKENKAENNTGVLNPLIISEKISPKFQAKGDKISAPNSVHCAVSEGKFVPNNTMPEGEKNRVAEPRREKIIKREVHRSFIPWPQAEGEEAVQTKLFWAQSNDGIVFFQPVFGRYGGCPEGFNEVQLN